MSFFPQEFIDRGQKLHLHPNQEHMRYNLAQALSHDERKHKDNGVFSKLGWH